MGEFSNRERRLLWALASVVLGYMVYQYFVGTVYAVWGSWDSDFTAYYAAAMALERDSPVYNPSPWPLARENVLANVPVDGVSNPKPNQLYLYPPFLAWCLRPATHIPYWMAEGLWSALLHVTWWLGLILLFRMLISEEWLNAREAFLLGVLATYWAPMFFAFWVGQVTLAILFVLVLHFCLAMKKRDILAGIVLAVAVMVKVTPVVFVPMWLLQRRWKLVSAFAISAGAIMILTGAKQNYYYFTSILEHASLGENHPINHTIMGTYLRHTVGKPWGWLQEEQYRSIAGMHWFGRVFLVGGLIATWWGTWKPANRRAFRLSFAVLLLAMVVFVPVARLHCFVYLYPAVVLLLADLKAYPGRLALSVVIFAVAVNTSNLAAWFAMLAVGPISDDIIGHPSTLAAIALWGLACYRHKKVIYG